MPTPCKPFSILKNENKSHRTKAELNQRQQGEKSLITGVTLKERPEVKNNSIAHTEFLRLNELLCIIDKNDAIYEGVINRYCKIHSECFELEKRRDDFSRLVKEIRKIFKSLNGDADQLIDLSRELARITTAMNNIDSHIQQKRKMLFDIEKENILTIASALRSVPKQVTKEESPLIEALRDVTG